MLLIRLLLQSSQSLVSSSRLFNNNWRYRWEIMNFQQSVEQALESMDLCRAIICQNTLWQSLRFSSTIITINTSFKQLSDSIDFLFSTFCPTIARILSSSFANYQILLEPDNTPDSFFISSLFSLYWLRRLSAHIQRWLIVFTNCFYTSRSCLSCDGQFNSLLYLYLFLIRLLRWEERVSVDSPLNSKPEASIAFFFSTNCNLSRKNILSSGQCLRMGCSHSLVRNIQAIRHFYFARLSSECGILQTGNPIPGYLTLIVEMSHSKS